MELYRTDTKLLTRMKQAQGSLTGYALVTDTHVCSCAGFRQSDVDHALESPQRVHRLSLPPDIVKASLVRMDSLGLIRRTGTSPAYQVTYDGWNARSVRVKEVSKLILTHILFPFLVAFLTTVFTLLVDFLLKAHK